VNFIGSILGIIGEGKKTNDEIMKIYQVNKPT